MSADKIVRHEGRSYLIRDGEVYVKLRKWWSSDSRHVSAETRAIILALK